MARVDDDFAKLKGERAVLGQTVVQTPLPSGSRLIEVRDYMLPEGWDHRHATLLFLAPPAFPAAQPDCFWVEPVGEGAPRDVRFGGGRTPQNSNDSNQIPEVGQRGTWFSWHLQSWDPNIHTLSSFFRVIEQR